jgi:hypothetical protein
MPSNPDDLHKRPVFEHENTFSQNQLNIVEECRKQKHENSWRERYSSHKHIFSNKQIAKIIDSERKLRHSALDSQNMDAVGFPSFRNQMEQGLGQKFKGPLNDSKFANYFSDRELAKVSFQKINPTGQRNHFHLETLDEDLLRRKTIDRHLSMRMIEKRGFDVFSNKIGENLGKNMIMPPNNNVNNIVNPHAWVPNPIVSMKVIDEKFQPISFKSRESFSHSRIGEEPKIQHFSPFPLSKINEGFHTKGEIMKRDIEDQFINNLGKGAFKKTFVNRDPTTKAVTRSDMRIMKNSVLSSPFEYNMNFNLNMKKRLDTIQPHQFDQKLLRRTSLNNLNHADLVNFGNPLVMGSWNKNFTSQRNLHQIYHNKMNNTLSWRNIKMPHSAKQINNNVHSNRRISFNKELGSCLKETLNLKNTMENFDNQFKMKSKRDLLGIETKYINQDGEDKSAIEENLDELQNLSADDEDAKEFEIFDQKIEKKSLKSSEQLIIPKVNTAKVHQMSKDRNKTSLEKPCTSGKIKPFVLENNLEKKVKNDQIFGKQKFVDFVEEEDSDESCLRDIPNENQKMIKIKENLNTSLKEFDRLKEFQDFHNLLGLLSCLFVTGEIEDRYLVLKPDEKSILIAIVYRKFKRTLSPE